MSKSKSKSSKTQIMGAGKDILDIIDLLSKGKKHKAIVKAKLIQSKVKEMPSMFIHQMTKAKKKRDEILKRLGKRKVGGGPKVKQFFKKLNSWIKGHIKMKPATVLKHVLYIADKLIDIAAEAKLPYAGDIKVVKDLVKGAASGDIKEITKSAKEVIKLGKKIASSKKGIASANILSKMDNMLGPYGESSMESGIIETSGKGLSLPGGGRYVSKWSGGNNPEATGAYMGKGVEGRIKRLKKRKAKAKTMKSKERLGKKIVHLEANKEKIKKRNKIIGKIAKEVGLAALPVAAGLVGGPAAATATSLGAAAIEAATSKGKGLKLPGQGLSLPGGKMKVNGTKEEVWMGMAKKTSGGLMKSDLIKNKKGKIVSKKMYEKGKKLAMQYGYKKK